MAMFFSNFFESPTTILTSLGIIIFLWELVEYLMAKISRSAKYIKKTFGQKNITPGWKDTILDVFMDFAGAIAFLYFFI